MLLSNKQITKALTILPIIAQAGLHLCSSHKPSKTGFLASRPISFAVVMSHDKVKYEFFISNLKFN